MRGHRRGGRTVLGGAVVVVGRHVGAGRGSGPGGAQGLLGGQRLGGDDLDGAGRRGLRSEGRPPLSGRQGGLPLLPGLGRVRGSGNAVGNAAGNAVGRDGRACGLRGVGVPVCGGGDVRGQSNTQQ